jgi:hypothetical protein
MKREAPGQLSFDFLGEVCSENQRLKAEIASLQAELAKMRKEHGVVVAGLRRLLNIAINARS